ncbi:MAG: dihydrolipoyl dehydrogenase [Desulfuromonadales bacterium]|nr:dihydrolipoyl dehydrogenase [Desulfuromonadales bacterium]
MAENIFDLVVIGGGPGGYVAAIRAAQLGERVVVVEQRATLGGVCLNEGCIPSKALLDSSEYFSLARDEFAGYGIDIEAPRLNLARMQERKAEVVTKLTGGIALLFKKHKIKHIQARGILGGTGEGGRRVQLVDAADGLPAELVGRKVLLATGGQPLGLSELPFDGQRIVDSTAALAFTEVPEHLVVIGGGFIGLELGSVWRRLGAQVTVVEMLPHILPQIDRKIAATLQRALHKQGFKFHLQSKITAWKEAEGGIKATVTGPKGADELSCDKLLVAIGRKPVTAGLGLEDIGVALTAAGRVQVDADYQTSVAGVYALGDLIDGPPLAHKAMEEGVAFVERQHGRQTRVDLELIPGVVYTMPEVATIGKTEEQLQGAGTDYTVGKFAFLASGRAHCLAATEGLVKVLAAPVDGRVLGVHIVGPRASELIAEATAVMSFSGSVQDIAATVHAHPTLAEAFKEAALAVEKAAIHG